MCVYDRERRGGLDRGRDRERGRKKGGKRGRETMCMSVIVSMATCRNQFMLLFFPLWQSRVSLVIAAGFITIKSGPPSSP